MKYVPHLIKVYPTKSLDLSFFEVCLVFIWPFFLMVPGVKGFGGRLWHSAGTLSLLKRWSSFTKSVPWGANLRVTEWWSLMKFRNDVENTEQEVVWPRMWSNCFLVLVVASLRSILLSPPISSIRVFWLGISGSRFKSPITKSELIVVSWSHLASWRVGCNRI